MSMRAKDISDEGLAAILRAMAITGCGSSDERGYIWEAAERLEKRKRMIEIEGITVKVYPDNDGGLWYYHPITGKVVRIP